MDNNIKVVYQSYGDSIMLITYKGYEITSYETFGKWEFWRLPECVKRAFGIDDDE